MKNYFVKIIVEDPYPKSFEYTESGTGIEIAIRRTIKKFRKDKWQRRPLKEIKIYAKLLK